MQLWQHLVLGAVEGFTEYLPVSSTGHLLLAQRVLGIESSEASNAYAIAIQAGAIAAVLSVYRQRLSGLLTGSLEVVARGARSAQAVARARLALALVLAFVPAAALGLLGKHWIEAKLFGLWPVSLAWVLGGVLILFFGRGLQGRQGRSLEQLGLGAAILIGVAQCSALWPGVSRSLATLAGGLLVGLSLSAAVEFAFLLGLVTLTAAASFQVLKSHDALLASYAPLELAAGFGVAWLSAWLSVRWMVRSLQRFGLAPFGWYRLVLGLTVATLLWAGWLPA